MATGHASCDSLPSHLSTVAERLLCHRPASRLTVRELAVALGLSERQLRRAIRVRGQTSARDVIILTRVAYAPARITAGDKICAAMFLAGFRNKSNFNRQFRACLGCSPSEFRSALTATSGCLLQR